MSLQEPNSARGRRWTRSYPPLALLAVAILVAVLILPSSLNLPQADPSTVLEYAPIPPEDEEPPPPADGNLESLGLGSSNTLAAGGVPPPPPPDSGRGDRPLEKRCVGNPPRQTEDQASPPCVPFFDGDNFGATYQGVSRKEITVLVYFDNAGYGPTGEIEGAPTPGTYVDINKPALPACGTTGVNVPTNPNECDHILIRLLRAFSRYFNNRYQTYDRRVHYWAYFADSTASAAKRRGDAVANWERLKPFAVIDSATFGGYNAEYQTAMTQLGVLTFSSTQGALTNAFYRKIAPLAWGFYPDVEHWATLYATYVCQKVAPFPVRRYDQGTSSPNGGKRRFGLWYTDDPAQPDLQHFARVAKKELNKCGVTWVEEATFSRSGYAVDAGDTGADAVDGVARFVDANVTTILYLGGTEVRMSAAADSARYYPEIVVAGDLDNDNNFIGTVQNQNVWRNAWAMTYHVRINRLVDSPGYRAYKEGNPSGDDNVGPFARDMYRDHFMLFQAIQVAGPRLNPQTIDEGFHAIPEKGSTDPYVAAFFFDPGDYTSVKDAAEQWWDILGRPRGSNQPGCWKMVNEGRRSLAGDWKGGDQVFRDTNDPCTGYGGSIQTRAG